MCGAHGQHLATPLGAFHGVSALLQIPLCMYEVFFRVFLFSFQGVFVEALPVLVRVARRSNGPSPSVAFPSFFPCFVFAFVECGCVWFGLRGRCVLRQLLHADDVSPWHCKSSLPRIP